MEQYRGDHLRLDRVEYSGPEEMVFASLGKTPPGILRSVRDHGPAALGGVSGGEVDVAAYKMDLVSKRRDKAEADLQRVITRMTVLDSTIEIIQQKAELERKGVRKSINEMPEDDLEERLEAIAIQRKETDIGLDRIVEMFEVDTQAVKARRSAGSAGAGMLSYKLVPTRAARRSIGHIALFAPSRLRKNRA